MSQKNSDQTSPALSCADLPPLLQFADGRPVRSKDDWALRRAEIRRLMCETFVGSPPNTIPLLLGSELIEDMRRADGTRLRRVQLTFDTPTRAAFTIELQNPQGEGPFPVFMFAGPYGWWPEVALERGYLVCGYPGADKNDSSDILVEAYPGCTWSRLLRRAWLGSRALDYLLTLPDVIPGQICMSGHSRNGKQSLIAAAFDNRITAVAASSAGSPGTSPYRFTSHDTFNEAPDGFVNNWFLESLRGYTGREHDLPLDAHGWYGLIAPRPCLISTAWNDGCDPTFAVERGYLAGREAYRFLDRPEALRIRWRPGWHPANRAAVQAYFDWFDHWFGRPARSDAERFPETLLHHFDWNAWRAGQPEANILTPDAGADIQTRMAWMLGTPPSSVPWKNDAEDEQTRGTREVLGLPPPEPVVCGAFSFHAAEESKAMDHDRWGLPDTARIPVSFGENVRGNLYYNATIAGPMPAVIWLHPASYSTGYNEAYGPPEWLQSPWTTPPPGVKPTTLYHRLAKAGHAVLAFDQCGFGLRLLEGRDFHHDFPHWSRLGRMLHDVRRAVDFLADQDGASATPLPTIDAGQIVVVGYAGGGMVALHAAALDPRLAGVAAVCGCLPWRDAANSRATGGNRRWSHWHALLPKLGLFEGRERDIPYDADDLLARIAPRPSLLISPLRDRTVSHEAVLDCVTRGRKRSPRPDSITLHTPDDINRLQTAQQDMILDWLKKSQKENHLSAATRYAAQAGE